jgi:plasmid stability protein
MISTRDSIEAMATIIIRNLDDEVAERLRLQARLRGVSVEQEARRVLAEGTKLSRREIAVQAAAMRARQPRSTVSSVDLIREDRDR